jgi:hypothetical protein
MSVPVEGGSTFKAGNPTRLFEGRYYGGVEAPNNPGRTYDISPDGQRFLMIKQPEQATSAAQQINVVLNWFEELKRLVPTK